MNESLVILHFNIVTGIDEGKRLVTETDEDVTGINDLAFSIFLNSATLMFQLATFRFPTIV
jgi:hypothetical protein